MGSGGEVAGVARQAPGALSDVQPSEQFRHATISPETDAPKNGCGTAGTCGKIDGQIDGISGKEDRNKQDGCESPQTGSQKTDEQITFDVLTPDTVQDIARKLDASTRKGVGNLKEVLAVRELAALLERAIGVFKAEPTLVDLEVDNPETSVTVVGDTHGQFHDVLGMFSVAGLPSATSLFVFNGDFVDRGAWGLETLTLLLCWKLCLPNCVHLVRGNHESSTLTRFYGFMGELEAKYGKTDHKIVYKLCKKLFSLLPLAALVQNTTLIVHGGLFRKPLAKKRKKKRSFGKPRVRVRTAPLILGTLNDLRCSSKGGVDPDGQDPTNVASDVMWSDPVSECGMQLNESRGGVGLNFGPDVTQQFLQENGLKLIIRSHEGPDARDKRDDMPGMMEGHSVDHCVEDGKLMTVFSAPDYPQFQEGDVRYNNQASVLVLRQPDYCEPEIKQYSAVLPRPEASPFYDTSIPDSDEEMANGEVSDNGSMSGMDGSVGSCRSGSDCEVEEVASEVQGNVLEPTGDAEPQRDECKIKTVGGVNGESIKIQKGESQDECCM